MVFSARRGEKKNRTQHHRLLFVHLLINVYSARFFAEQLPTGCLGVPFSHARHIELHISSSPSDPIRQVVDFPRQMGNESTSIIKSPFLAVASVHSVREALNEFGVWKNLRKLFSSTCANQTVFRHRRLYPFFDATMEQSLYSESLQL